MISLRRRTRSPTVNEGSMSWTVRERPYSSWKSTATRTSTFSPDVKGRPVSSSK